MGAAFSAMASYLRSTANELNFKASRASKLGNYTMRENEWTLQRNLAGREIMQIDKQIAAAEIRAEIAALEKRNTETQIEHAQEIEEFMRDKYTNKDLYSWMVGQISDIYFRAYKLAYDVAKRAEQAYRHELGLKDSSFIQFGYWDSLKKGLLSGERLYHDIKRMEMAYLDQNRREYEVTKHVSLLQTDPTALLRLKQTGECFFTLPEAIFDFDYPGHYMRRIKTVSITIPCITGPYTGVSCTLTLLKSTVRHQGTLSGGKYARQENDPRFTDKTGAIQSIVTSSAQNDSGMFELRLNDERYLHFEGAGAISEWHIELPKEFRQLDYGTISDCILHINYTAREGGNLLRQQAIIEMKTAVNEIMLAKGTKGLSRLFSASHEFPNAWHNFLYPSGDTQIIHELDLDLDKNRFPYMFSRMDINLKTLRLFLKLAKENENLEGLSLGYSLLDAGDTIITKTGSSTTTTGELTLSGSPIKGMAYDEIPVEAKLEPGRCSIEIDPGNQGQSLPPNLIQDINGITRLNPYALEDLIVICEYTVS